MKHRANNNFTRHGFTLLELTIAMVLVASLTVTLYRSLRVASMAQTKAQEAVDQSSQFDLALNVLRADLENMPPSYSLPSTSAPATPSILAWEFTASQGTGNGPTSTVLSFYTCGDGLLPLAQTGQMQPQSSSSQQQQPPVQSLQQQAQSQQQQQQQWNPASEIKGIQYDVEVPPGDSRQCLVRRVWDNVQALAINQDDPPPQTICRGVSQFTLRYWDGTTWQTTWDTNQTQFDFQTPAAIEVTLQLEAKPRSNDAPKTFVCVIPVACSNVANDPNYVPPG